MNTTMFVLCCSFFLTMQNAQGQAFKQQFQDLFSKKDTIGQIKLLVKWEAADKNDPELYVSYFNYYANQSRHAIVRLESTKPDDKKAIQLLDTNNTNGKPVGYLYDDIDFDVAILNKGITYINEGLRRYPTRLDMRFGKIYMYGQIKDYTTFTGEIINTIEYSSQIENKWTWTDSKNLEEPQKFMLGAIQDYIMQLYDTNNDSLLDNMKSIAETVLKYYPNHVESMSNIAIVHLVRGEYDKALDELLPAEKLSPKDNVILNNIAEAYKRKSDKANAIRFYQKLIQYGDAKAKKYAKEQIDNIE
ncbi:tetratricopeptide repeat protein [bacterium]|nr:tetratricopeptide repeat protein [bacterium]